MSGGEWAAAIEAEYDRAARQCDLSALEKDRDQWKARAEAAEDALRSLASYVGNGGYNAPVVDAKEFRLKVVEGIDTLTSVEASRRETLNLKYETACGTIRTMQAEREALMQRIHAQASERDEARAFVARLVRAMKEWGSWEDGVPDANCGGDVGAAFDAAVAYLDAVKPAAGGGS